jgi:hypothetical protein
MAKQDHGAVEEHLGKSSPVQGLSLCEWIYASKGVYDPVEALRSIMGQVKELGERCVHVGRTPLMLCAQKGWSACVLELLAAGACPDERDEQNRDALMLSLIARKVDCARLLAPLANLRARDKDGRAPLALAVIHAPHRVDFDLLAMLWRPGVDRWRGTDGKTACDWAQDKDVAVMPEWLCFKNAAMEARILGRVCNVWASSRRSALRM